MSTLPTIYPSTSMVLNIEPLTPEAFAPFGSVVTSPISRDLNIVPSDLSRISEPSKTPTNHNLIPNSQTQFANQNTALKTSPVSPLVNNYHGQSRGLVSIFSCFPRKNVYIDDNDSKFKLRVNILERHPYTTQTFCPFNYSESSDKTIGGRTYFLVIVASNSKTDMKTQQTRKSVGDDVDVNADEKRKKPSRSISNPPDLSSIRAFIAPSIADDGSGTAITYNPGTWHAPMIVLGERRIDFLVSQFVNGVDWDDCQEVLVGETPSKTSQLKKKSNNDQNIVEVDLSGLGLEDTYLWKNRRAKL